MVHDDDPKNDTRLLSEGYGSSMVKRNDERGDIVADRRAVRLRLGLRPATRHTTRTVPQLSRAN